MDRLGGGAILALCRFIPGYNYILFPGVTFDELDRVLLVLVNHVFGLFFVGQEILVVLVFGFQVIVLVIVNVFEVLLVLHALDELSGVLHPVFHFELGKVLDLQGPNRMFLLTAIIVLILVIMACF